MLLFNNATYAVTGITLKSKCQHVLSRNQPDDLGSTPDYDSGLCMGYIMGAASTLKLPCSQTESPQLLSEEVVSYLDSYPEKLTQHAGNLIMEALKDSPLCKPARPERRSKQKKKH